MCLAIPAQVVEISGNETAIVELGRHPQGHLHRPAGRGGGGRLRHRSRRLCLERLNVAEAEETLRLFAELARSMADHPSCCLNHLHNKEFAP